MFTKEVTVRSMFGLENKKATSFVQKANEFMSVLRITVGERNMNAKSLLGVISLEIKPGVKATVTGDGRDEESAVLALAELLETP